MGRLEREAELSEEILEPDGGKPTLEKVLDSRLRPFRQLSGSRGTEGSNFRSVGEMAQPSADVAVAYSALTRLACAVNELEILQDSISSLVRASGTERAVEDWFFQLGPVITDLVRAANGPTVQLDTSGLSELNMFAAGRERAFQDATGAAKEEQNQVLREIRGKNSLHADYAMARMIGHSPAHFIEASHPDIIAEVEGLYQQQIELAAAAGLEEKVVREGEQPESSAETAHKAFTEAETRLRKAVGPLTEASCEAVVAGQIAALDFVLATYLREPELIPGGSKPRAATGQGPDTLARYLQSLTPPAEDYLQTSFTRLVEQARGAATLIPGGKEIEVLAWRCGVVSAANDFALLAAYRLVNEPSGDSGQAKVNLVHHGRQHRSFIGWAKSLRPARGGH